MDVKKSSFGESLKTTLTRRFATYQKKDAFTDLTAGLFAFLFAGAHGVFGAFPFGIALLAVVRRHVLAVFLGTLLGTLRLGSVAPVYLCVYALLFLVRVLLSYPRRVCKFLPQSPALFSEEPALRIATALLFCFGASVYELFYGNAALYVVYFCLAMVLLGPLAAFLFLPFVERGDGFRLLLSPVTEETAPPLLWQASVLSLAFVTARSLAGLSLFGISADLFLSAFFVFFFSKRFGAWRSAAAGAFLSLPFGLIALPTLSLLGLVAGPLWRFGGVYALSIASAAASILCGYLGGVAAFVSLMPELYCSALLAWPIYSKIAVSYDPRASLALPSGAPLPKEVLALPEAEKKGSLRLQEMSKAFGSLSELFGELSRKRQKPTYEEYYDAAASACREHCTACRGQAACWKRDGAAEVALGALTERVLCNAELTEDALPPALLCNCKSVDKLLETARHAFAEASRAHHSQNRTEHLATDYALVSRLFEEAAKEERVASAEDVKATVALAAAFRELGIETEKVAVYGNRRRRVVAGGKGWQGKQIAADTLRGAAEKVCGTALTDPEFFLGKDEVRMQMESRPRFGAEVATSSHPSCSGEVSGDTVDAFKNREDFFYAYVSDGMGSGREAALTSGLCGEFLKRMLEVGCSKTVTLRLLNQMVRTKGGETFATVDLLEVDLLTGAACFVKSGAVNSFVKRGDNLFRIRAGTSPVGILPTLDAERINFEVRVGDIIIMMSDGVAPTPEVPSWLLEALGGDLSGDLSLSAERLVELAQKENSAADDTSICLIRITPPKKTLA